MIPGTSTALGRWAIKIGNVGAPLNTFTYLIDVGNINSKPDWSLDSQTIFFHRMVPADGYRFRVFSIRPDSTGLTELTGRHRQQRAPLELSFAVDTVFMRAPLNLPTS